MLEPSVGHLSEGPLNEDTPLPPYRPLLQIHLAPLARWEEGASSAQPSRVGSWRRGLTPNPRPPQELLGLWHPTRCLQGLLPSPASSPPLHPPPQLLPVTAARPPLCGLQGGEGLVWVRPLNWGERGFTRSLLSFPAWSAPL